MIGPDLAPAASAVRPRILVAEDDRRMRELIAAVLGEIEPNVEIVTAADAHEAMDLFEADHAAVVLTDLRMPGADGLDLLKFVRQRDPQTQVVLVTGHGTVESAVAALKQGAFDYVEKPFDTVKLRCVVENALRHYLLATENERLRQQQRSFEQGGEIIGASQARELIERLIVAAAAYDSSVLVSGPSG
ncbi:MAG: response regulator, partial [Burkholderiales bacterium]|nr:response regulator [Burkholderiales bacterium]